MAVHIFYMFLILVCAVLPVQAKLIAHYNFSDGDLLDNEVGEAYALHAVQANDASLQSVRLNAVEGTAVFPGGTQVQSWLEAAGPGALKAYTVSFWFRTDRAFLGFPHLDFFSSHTDPAPEKQGILVPVRDCRGTRIGTKRLPDWPGKRVHAGGIWHHAVLRRVNETGRTEIYCTSQDEAVGHPVIEAAGVPSCLNEIVLGLNRGKDVRYRVEMANVKIFDDADISVDELFAEGPQTWTANDLSFFSIQQMLKKMDREAECLREELSLLPIYDDSLQLDAYGYHSSYLPALDTVPDEPRWTIELSSELPFNFLELYLIPAADRRTPNRPGYGFPLRFRIVSFDQNDEQTVLADWRDSDYPDPDRFPARFPGTDSSLKRIVLEVYRGQVEGGLEYFALDELFVSARYFISEVLNVTASSSFESPPFWSSGFLNDQKTGYGLPVLRSSREAYVAEDFIRRFPMSFDGPYIVDLDLKTNRQIDLVVLYPAQPPEGIVVPGFGFPESVQIETFVESSAGERVPIETFLKSSLPNPGNNVLRFHGHSKMIRWIRFVFDQLPFHEGKQTFAMGEIGLRGLTESYGKDAVVKVSGSDTDSYLLTDGLSDGAEIIPMIQWLDGLGRRSSLSRRLGKVEALQQMLESRKEIYQRALLWTVLVLFICSLTAVALNAIIQKRRHARRLRQQIATDLHDDIGSRMSAISLATTYLCKVSEDPKVHERSGKIERIAGEMQSSLADVLWFTNSETDSLRQMVGKLLDVSELRIPPEQLCIEVTSLKQIPESSVAVQFKRDLLFLFKEIVNNAAKHSDASQIKVAIQWKRPVLCITVSDNGKGFSVDEELRRQHRRPHLGLNSMQRRASRLGAKLNIESAPGEGTVVTVRVRT
ncbi:sensor histidine kinase [Tichowtungia aerotolerans]|uniref:Histidine kinase domain-containing protein n=1 Tax=Tichowtungia aerotolerans TaxID=2697043 RepID=A0A6P1MD06_9BACT|nr:ATP-binding protein [Tichowtungia aerotolerans]QHI69948.1 hypothetical protein GT409_10955 [Tichowtungia aerotolerans]